MVIELKADQRVYMVHQFLLATEMFFSLMNIQILAMNS